MRRLPKCLQIIADNKRTIWVQYRGLPPIRSKGQQVTSVYSIAILKENTAECCCHLKGTVSNKRKHNVQKMGAVLYGSSDVTFTWQQTSDGEAGSVCCSQCYKNTQARKYENHCCQVLIKLTCHGMHGMECGTLLLLILFFAEKLRNPTFFELLMFLSYQLLAYTRESSLTINGRHQFQLQAVQFCFVLDVTFTEDVKRIKKLISRNIISDNRKHSVTGQNNGSLGDNGL